MLSIDDDVRDGRWQVDGRYPPQKELLDVISYAYAPPPPPIAHQSSSSIISSNARDKKNELPFLAILISRPPRAHTDAPNQ